MAGLPIGRLARPAGRLVVRPVSRSAGRSAGSPARSLGHSPGRSAGLRGSAAARSRGRPAGQQVSAASRPLARSPVGKLTHSPAQPVVRSAACSPARPLVRLPARPLTCSPTPPRSLWSTMSMETGTGHSDAVALEYPSKMPAYTTGRKFLVCLAKMTLIAALHCPPVFWLCLYRPSHCLLSLRQHEFLDIPNQIFHNVFIFQSCYINIG